MPAPSGWPRKVAALLSRLFISVGRSESSSAVPYMARRAGTQRVSGCGERGGACSGRLGKRKVSYLLNYQNCVAVFLPKLLLDGAGAHDGFNE